jgi:ERCC4-type nuclease
MKVIIDERERDLYAHCTTIVNSNNTFIQLSKEVLPLGDISITTDEGKPVMIIERKSLQDLLASIKDGRYEEQSYRLLHSSGFPPHSVIYLIEGGLNELRTPMEKKIVYSAMTSLNFFKGFSVLRTMNVKESAEYIVWMSEKIEKNFLKSVFPYYLQPQFCQFMQRPVVNLMEPPIELDDQIPSIEKRPIQQNELQNIIREPDIELSTNTNDIYSNINTNNNNTELTSANYCTVVKKVKKDNITPENIGEIILCQIPGISSVSAIAIMKKFTTFPNLFKELENNPNCLNDIVCETKGKSRKLGKNCIDNVRTYLSAKA